MAGSGSSSSPMSFSRTNGGSREQDPPYISTRGIVILAAIGLAGAASLAAQQAAAPAVPDTIVFNRDVRPILSDKCYQCHGPGTQMATLRFDTEEGAKKALRDNRFAIVPGDPDHSEVI